MPHRIIDSPVGPLTLVVDSEGVLCGVYFDGHSHPPTEARLGARDDSVADDAVRQLGEYFAGTRTEFDLDLAPNGTDFQRSVWDQLRAIPFGRTTGYGQVASALGKSSAARAVGAATGRNPISIIVPCHRLVGRSGALTGYAGGVDRKKWLLDHEAAVSARHD